MRVIIQRVSEASVTVDSEVVSRIENGALIFLGVSPTDSATEISWLTKKIANLRIFNDNDGVMNLSLLDIEGDALVVSQFTLMAKTKKGNRPSYINAAKPEQAIPLYEAFVDSLEQELKKKVRTGIFGADMKIQLLNDGPVTITLDTENK
jgi:D-tyrosyl-tRNA(Tyr) deacylase